MRHQQTTTKLNRPVGPRKALIKNLLSQLYTYESITTTHAKAKLITPLANRLIHQAKTGTIHTRRQINTLLNKQVVKKLVDQIATRYPNKTSGFTRIIKLGTRTGDNTLMVKLELIKTNKHEKKQKITNSQKLESKN